MHVTERMVAIDALLLPPGEKAARARAGHAEAVRAGRVVEVRCALADGRLNTANALIPPGQPPEAVRAGALMRMRLGDLVSATPNQLLGPVTEPVALREGWLPEDWRSRDDPRFARIPPEGRSDAFLAAQYRRVGRSYIVACLPAAG